MDKEREVGDILVEQYGYSMVLYNFYRISNVTKKQMTLIPLEKECLYDSVHDGFHPIVRPSYKCLEFSKSTRCLKSSHKYVEYDPKRLYVEDHLD